MLGMGTVVGGSFFLGTAISLKAAGIGTLIAFAVGGVLVYLILRALSEMTVSRPAHGSFREYAEVAFGPMASYVVGWLYWAGLVLALSSEATAAALFARLWLPGAPIWLLSLGIIVGVTLLNLLDVRVFSTVESVMAAVKLIAIALFILLVGGVLVGLVPGGRPAPSGAPFLPGGLGGLAGSMLTVLFTYAGFEVMGLAAPDARDPQRTVPRAVLLTALGLVVLYMGAMAVILPVLPPALITPEVSPLIQTLERSGFPRLAPWLNFVVLSASLSTMLAAMYGLSRMLYSLAEEGQAPAAFKRISADGMPRPAILASGAGMLVGVVLAFLLPKQVYVFLVSSGGFALLFSYLMILASQLRIRKREGCKPGLCQMPLFPYSTWFGIVGILAAIAAMPLVPGQGAGLMAGLGMLAVIAVSYMAVRRRAPNGPGRVREVEETAVEDEGRVPLA
jgi:AAT family amino acid transporter